MKHLQPKQLLLLLATCLFSFNSFGQTAPVAQSLPYSQDFSGLAHSSSAYPAGWQGMATCTSSCGTSTFRTTAPISDRLLLANSSAANNTGGVHNYNGKIGILLSSSVDPNLVLAINTTGHYNVLVSFDAMTIRNPYDGTSNTRINGFDLQYRTSDISGTWTSVTGLTDGFYQNITTTQTGSGVTTPQNLQSFSFTLPSDCNNQSVVYLRWVNRDISGTGSRPSFAVDNINICAPPSITSTSSNSPICIGSTLNLSVSASGAGPLSYVWSGTGTFSPSNTVSNPSVTGAATGNYTVTVTNACGSTTSTVAVTVSDPSVSGTPTDVSCFGNNDGEISLSLSGGISPYTCNWSREEFMVMHVTKDPSHPYYGVGSSFGYEIDGVQGKELTLVRGVTYSFNIMAPGHPFYISTDANGAGAGEVTAGVTGSQTDMGILTFTPDASHPSLLYYQCFNHLNMGWKLNIVDGLSGCDLSGLMPGQYTVNITDNAGCQTSASITINEPSALTASAGNNGPVCQGTTLSLTSSPAGGTTPYSFTWSGPGGYSSTDENPDITSATPSNSGTYTVTVTDVNGCTATSSTTATVIALVTTAPVITSFPATACPGDFTTWTINPVANATSYDWYGTDTSYVNITGTGTTVTVEHLATTFSGYEINVRGQNSCGVGPSSKKWSRRTLSVPGLNGPAIACGGETKTYTIPVALPYAVSYTFSAPAGSSITDGVNTGNPLTTTALSVNVTFPISFTTGSVCVFATGPCEPTASRCIAVKSTPVISSAISGSSSVCPPVASTIYSIPPVAGAVSYSWTLPAGITMINDLGNSAEVSIAGSFVSGSICVAANYGCGFGTNRCLSLKSQKPSTPGSMTGPIAGVCNAAFNYTVPNVSGVTYNWTATNSATVTPSGNTANVDFSTATAFPVNVCVTASNACATSAARCLNNIKGVPANPATLTGSATECKNATGIAYSTTGSSGASTYRWSAPTGSVVTDGSSSGNPLITTATSVTVNFGSTSGNMSVIAQNTCGNSGAKSLYVTLINCRESVVDFSDQSTVYPNPANGNAELKFLAEQNGIVTIELVDLSGRIINSQSLTAQQGINLFPVDLTAASKGAYLLVVKQGSNTVRMPLLVE